MYSWAIESKEGDPHGKNYINDIKWCSKIVNWKCCQEIVYPPIRSQKVINVIYKEAGIFKICKNTEVRYDAQQNKQSPHNEPLPWMMDQQSAGKIDESDKEEKE